MFVVKVHESGEVRSRIQLLTKVVEFYECTWCRKEYVFLPIRCIKCNHYSFEFISVRLCTGKN